MAKKKVPSTNVISSMTYAALLDFIKSNPGITIEIYTVPTDRRDLSSHVELAEALRREGFPSARSVSRKVVVTTEGEISS